MPAWYKRPHAFTMMKAAFLVLCLNTIIPSMPPSAPPHSEVPKRTLSGMRHLPRTAARLSVPYIIKFTKDISATAAQIIAK